MSMYIVVAIVFGLVAGITARSKGRSAIGWFLAGLIIGPFALVVVVLPAKAREGRLMPCPACLEVINHEARICRHCGTQIG